MTKLKVLIELKKIKKNLAILKENYRITGDKKYSEAYTKMSKIYNEFIEILKTLEVKKMKDLEGFANEVTAEVIRQIENDSIYKILAGVGDLANYGNKDLIDSIVELFCSDTTENGLEICCINCDEIREYLDEL